VTFRRPRRALAGLLVILPFAVLLLSRLVWPDPPPELPTHWNAPGEVDSTTAGTTYLGVVLGVSGFCAVLASLVSPLSAFVADAWSRWVLTLLGAVGAGAASSYGLAVVGTALANGRAGEVGLVWGLGAVLVAAVWAWGVYAAHGRRVPPRAEVLERIPERDRVVPVADGPGETWETEVGSRLLTGTAVFVAVVFGVCGALVVTTDAVAPAVVLVLLGLVLAGYVLAWSRIRVRADAEGLTIRSAVLPLRLRQVPAAEVLGVSRIDLDPMAWGGYGLRSVPGRTAYVVRGGPAVVVHRATGHRLAIEVTAGEEVADAGARVLRRSAGRALEPERGGR
jgi:ABC-type glycerol-3-phosphate transport system permease component